MNAPALNSATTPAPAQPGAIASAASSGQAGNPLAAFDALLAALFPQTAPPPVPAPEVVAGTEDTGSVDAPAAIDLLEPEASLLPGDANAGLPGGPFGGTTIVASSLPAAVETINADDTAWGRNKARGAPAAPALANANPRAGLAETAEPVDETPSGDAPLSAQPGTPQSQNKGGPTAPSMTPANTPAAGQASAPSARPVVAEPPPVDAAAAIVQTASTQEASTDAAAQPPAAASLGSRPEPSPAPTARNARSERAKGVSEAKGASDLRPTEAVDNPVHAKVVPDSAKIAVASVDTDAARNIETEFAAETPDAIQQAETRATAQTLTPAALAGQAVRGSPETVANLAAQIIKKLEGQSTRFDLELNPGGLGKVDVRVDIGAQGQITAAMTFENPQAAADLRARAAELHRLLEQAGFDLSGGLSFDVAGDRGQQQRQAWQEQTDDNSGGFRGQAFRAALDNAGEAADAAVQGALRLRRGVSAGLDLRI